MNLAMDWSDLASKVIGLGAPILGGALGGPLGAVAGRMLAEAVGAADQTAEATNSALASADPNVAAAAARQAESQWLAAMAEIGRAQVTEIGLTQRAEMASEDPLQRWWRPIFALELSLLECPAFVLTLLHALWTGHEVGLNGFANLSALLMTYFGARLSVLGIYVNGRSMEKAASVTGQVPPSLVGELVKALAPNKKK